MPWTVCHDFTIKHISVKYEPVILLLFLYFKVKYIATMPHTLNSWGSSFSFGLSLRHKFSQDWLNQIEFVRLTVHEIF